LVCANEPSNEFPPSPIEDVANDSPAAAVASAPAAIAPLIPVAPLSANVVAPIVAAARPAEKAPLAKLEATEFPVAIAFWIITGAAIVLKIIQIPRNFGRS
jgi:hypothetical protein